jgi:hypothetical protein
MELKFIRKISWEEIWADWKKNEAGQKSWIEHFSREGFKNWEEWRSKYVEGFDEFKWELYEVLNPAKSVPEFLCWPFKAWKKYYTDDASFGSFASKLSENEKVLGIKEDFPDGTTLIGIREDEKIVIVEGCHRCSAISLGAKGRIFIALPSLAKDPHHHQDAPKQL